MTMPRPRRRHNKRSTPLVATFILVATVAAGSWSGATSAAACYRYGETVSLFGGHFSQVAPPVDGIVRDPRSDAGRLADLLILDVSLCVDGDAISAGVAAVTSIQLHCPEIDVSDGSIVSVTGRLLGAHTGNGHTPVLLACR